MPKMPKIFTKTLSRELSLIMVGAIAVLLLAALLVMFFFSRHALKDEVIKDADETLTGKAKQIDNFLLSVEQSAGNVYLAMITTPNGIAQAETFCREMVRCNPYIIGCAIAFDPQFQSGNEHPMTYVRRKNFRIADGDTTLVAQYVFTKRPYTQQIWYTEPIETGRAGWLGPLKNEDTEGVALLTFSMPIYDRSRQRVGVFAVDITLRQLSRTVLSDGQSPGCYVTLLSRDGSYIVHPDTSKLAHHTVFSMTAKNSVEIRRQSQENLQEVGEAMVSGATGFKPLYINGTNNYVLFRPFSSEKLSVRASEDNGWSIGVVYPDEIIFHEYDQLLYMLIAVSICVLLVFYVFCYRIIHLQLRPLRHLTKSAQHIAAGNYSELIPDTRREDEIGQLQVHFQNMQQALIARMDEHERLSAQLKERGEVLQKAYDEVNKANKMKIAFLHFMTNQMLEPADEIERSVTDICKQCEGNPEKMNHLADTVWRQGKSLINILNRLIKEADDSSKDTAEARPRKEESAL